MIATTRRGITMTTRKWVNGVLAAVTVVAGAWSVNGSAAQDVQDKPEASVTQQSPWDKTGQQTENQFLPNMEQSEEPDISGFGCPLDEYECDRHCRNDLRMRGGYCGGFLRWVCTCFN